MLVAVLAAVWIAAAAALAPPARAATVSFVAPADGASYLLGQRVFANYTCTASPGWVMGPCRGLVANGEAIDTASVGSKLFHVHATEGNTTTRIFDVRYYVVDGSPPVVSIVAPVDGASYLLGQSVPAEYACSDEMGGSGIMACVGDVADGAAIDTASVGAKTFTVTATDNAGNTTTNTVSYTVEYDFAGFFAPVADNTLNVVTAGQSIPVKFSLHGDRGLGVLATGSPASTAVTCDSSLPAQDAAPTIAPGASGLTYDPASDRYSYVWKTSKQWAGSCRTLTVTLDDTTSHRAQFKLR